MELKLSISQFNLARPLKIITFVFDSILILFPQKSRSKHV